MFKSSHTPITNDTPISSIFPKSFPLNADILLYIFSLNASMEEETDLTEDKDPALLTLRHTSQVCTNWREIATGSPLLWARVLNLNFLSQKGDKWRKEVVRRTGTALLHFKSFIYTRRRPAKAEVVERLLSEYWTRIQSMDLCFGGSFAPDDDLWSSLFQRPAPPSLEVFKFEWSSTKPFHPLCSPHFVLFSDKAPTLRTLSTTNMTLNLTTFQVPNLRNLVLWLSLSAFDLLRALSHMPLLETLKAKSSYRSFTLGNGAQRSLPYITLPRLASINIHVRHSLETILFFLVHINPAKDCTVHFSGVYDYRDVSPMDNSQDLYRNFLSAYSGSYSQLTTATNLEVEYNGYYFLFGLEVSSHYQFYFELSTDGGYLPGGTLSSLLSSFIVMRLDLIRKLTLYLGYTDEVRSSPDVTKFILALVSVEELQTNSPTLKLLQDIQSENMVVTMPNLTIIHLNVVSHPNELSYTADFVRERIERGIPADALTMKIPASGGVDVESLRNSFPGLTVLPAAQEG